MMRKVDKKNLFFVVFFALTAIACFQIHPVLADVPSVLSVEPWTSGTHTILNFTVRHSSPTSSHYIDKIEVDVDGAVNDIDLTPQSTVTFVVQYDMGEVTDTPTVQARAHCIFHGWSDWSDPLVVPEFSAIILLLVLATVSIAVLSLKFEVYSSKKKNH